jgi:DNA-directed RNA polymerase subunit L
MATKAELYKVYLAREGYVPEDIENGDIRFKVQGETLVLSVSDDDRQYFKLTYYHTWHPEDTKDAWDAVNLVNARIKVVKVCIVNDVLFITTEAILKNVEDFESLFSRYLTLIAAGIQALRDALKQSKDLQKQPEA